MTNDSGITREIFAILAAPFAAKDHEFNRGFIYIEETAVCARIEDVDPSWEWTIVQMTHENDMSTVVGALTICGVTRHGTGQQLAQSDKNGKESVGESRKGATTDALKRAARLFGIGRYLLQCPKEVKGYGRELDMWLASVAKGVTPSNSPSKPATPPQQPHTSAPVQTPPSAPADAKSTAETPVDWLKEPRFATWAWDTFRIPSEGLKDILRKAKKPSLSKDEAKGAVLANFAGYDKEKVDVIAAEKELSVEAALFASSLSL